MRLRLVAAAALVLGALSPGAVAGPTLLFDPSDGKVLYAEDLDNQWHPASLTKMMTAYLAFEAVKTGKLKLEDKLFCSERAFLQTPSKVGLPIGAEMTVETALQALIVKSANDVAIMLAEAVAGSEDAFVSQMNATARRLGMSRTTFVNPNGLPAEEQVTTARDLARLARALLKDFPEFASYWAMSDMRFGKLRMTSHNGLLKSFEGADGMKTGFICDSGFNVVASATRDGRKLIAIVLGETTGQDRTIRAASLLEHGFQNYGWKTLFNTVSLDNIPIAPDAKGIESMRQSVISWECGTGRRTRAVAERQARIKAAKAKMKNGKGPAADKSSALVTTVKAPKEANAGATAVPRVSATGSAAIKPAAGGGQGSATQGQVVKSEAKPAQVSTGHPLPDVIKPRPKPAAPAAAAASGQPNASEPKSQ